MTKTERNYGLDLFRIFCCLGVLAYHVCDDCLTDNLNRFLWYSAAFCIPGFFLLSGYLIGQKDNISMEYCEQKIINIMKRFFGYVIFWSVILYVINGEYHNFLDEFENAALSSGILPVGWFLFTYAILMILAYPFRILTDNHLKIYAIVTISAVFLLSMDIHCRLRGLPSTPRFTQSLWLYIYVPYFMIGILLGKVCKLRTAILVKNCNLKIVMLAVGSVSFYLLFLWKVLFRNPYGFYPDSFYGSWFYTIWLFLFFFLCVLTGEKTKGGGEDKPEAYIFSSKIYI